MKICVVAAQSITFVNGGPLMQVRETVGHLRQLGVDVIYFSPWESLEAQASDLFHVFGANISTYEIAHSLYHFGQKLIISPIFFTQRGIAVIRTGIWMEKTLGRLGKGIWNDYGITRRVCRLGRAVLPNTSDESRLIERGLHIEPEKLVVVPNGVHERFLKADPELFVRTYGLKDFILNVGHVGSERKNVVNLIRAVKDLNHPLVIIGKVRQNAYAQQCLDEAAKNKNVRIIDGLPNDSEMLASAYAACKVFALPSLYETPGIAALEAALTTANIAITPFGGTKDYFGSHADYVHPHSVPSIRQGIENALNRPRTTNLRDHIVRNFLWQKVAEKTLEVYKKVLNSK